MAFGARDYILLGTENQIIVTGGTGSMVFSTPQDIGTGSTPTFSDLVLSSLTANQLMTTGVGGAVNVLGAATNGQLPIGSTGSAPVLAALTGTSNQIIVTNGAGSITLSTPQDIGTGSTPTFSDLILSSLTANQLVKTGTSGAIDTLGAATNGQIPIGSTGASPVLAALTGTANQVTVTNGAGSITLSLPTEISLGLQNGTPGSVRLRSPSSAKGATHYIGADQAGALVVLTITNDTMANPYTYSYPDVGTDAKFVMTEGDQTINGDKIFGGTITKTTQPSFLATQGAAANVTGDGTVFTMTWGTEVFDQGADFASGTFTAPVTGKYCLSADVELEGILNTHTIRAINIVTSNRTYTNRASYALAEATRNLHICVAEADMDAGDTATVTVSVSGSTKVVDIAAANNRFSGCLVN